jgi:hypothetical protein
VWYGGGLVGARSRRRGADCEEHRESRPEKSGGAGQ